MTKLLLGCVLFILGSSVLQAAEYAQGPGHFGGFGSDDSFAVADEFVFPQETPVKVVMWWGENVPEPASEHFKIRLFADDHGQPGLLLVEIDNGRILKKKTGDYLIRAGREQPNLYPEFEYSLVFTEQFIARARVKYWLSIVSVSADGWTWEASGSQKNLGVQRSVFTDPIYGPWTPYYDNTAFAVGSNPLLMKRQLGVLSH
jgi:hypothetical protein